MTAHTFTLDAALQGHLIERLCEKIIPNYIFPDVAQEIATTLQSHLEQGTYAVLPSGEAFCERVTADLQSVSRDKHLKVVFSEEAHDFQAESNLDYDPVWLEEYRQICLQHSYGFAKVERFPGNVGYLDVRAFEDAWLAGDALSWAMNLLAHTSALIIDLRSCSGGDPAMVALFCSYFFGVEPVHLNDLYARPTNSTQQYWTQSYVSGKRYLEKPVYVLTSHRTFSAAEEFVYNLQNLKRAIIVGEVTGGGANPRDTYQIHPHFALHLPTMRAINPITKTNWEGIGVQPDIEAPQEEALKVAQREALTQILESLGENPVEPLKMIQEEARKALEELN